RPGPRTQGPCPPRRAHPQSRPRRAGRTRPLRRAEGRMSGVDNAGELQRPSQGLPDPSSQEGIAPLDAHGAKVQAMFTDIAPGYDRANRLMSMGIDVRWRRQAVSKLLPAGADPDAARILDLCAGTLDSSLEIHRRYPNA